MQLEEAREAAAGAEALVQQLQDALKAKKASVGDAQKGPTVRDLKKRENEVNFSLLAYNFQRDTYAVPGGLERDLLQVPHFFVGTLQPL